MITARIQIGDGPILDTYAGHKLIYKSSDHRTEAPIKKRDVTTYSEQAGDNTDPRTVQDAFDYKVQFIVEAPNRDLQNANAVIAAFNKQLYMQSANSAIRTYKEVTFYNDYKRVKIVGLPDPIAEAKSLYRRQKGNMMDCAVVELTIHVSDPTKCDFNIRTTRIVKPSEIKAGDYILNVSSSSSESSPIASRAIISLRISMTNGNELRAKSDGAYIYDSSNNSEIKFLTASHNLTAAYKDNPAGLQELLDKISGTVSLVEGSNKTILDDAMSFAVKIQ